VHHFIPKEFVCALVLLLEGALALKAETVPLPRERPSVLEDQTSAPKIESERSPCQLQLSEIAEFKSMPPITGPGECAATDVVNVNAGRRLRRSGHGLSAPLTKLTISTVVR
jgi:hypothetical protein